MNKKQYHTPRTNSIVIEPLNILCASIYIDPNPGDGLVGS